MSNQHRRTLPAGAPARAALAAAALLAGAAVAAAGPSYGLTEIRPNDPTPETRFGYAVALDGERAIIGSLNDPSAGFRAGSVYIFRLDGGQWVQEAELFDPVPMMSGHLGTSVAIGGPLAVAGARAEAATVNIGAALVFRNGPDGWLYETTLRPPDVQTPQDGFGYFGFGHAVATDGERVVVTMPQDDIACPEDPMCNSGSAYVFRRDGSEWVVEQKLIPSDPQRLAHFGRSVAVSGDRLVIGAMQADDVSGAAYVFRREGASWVEEAKLVNPDPETGVVTQFGESIAMDGDAVAVGAPGDNDAGQYTGAVYVFRRGAGGWALEQKLIAQDAAALQFLGQSVGISGERILAGAYWDNHGGAVNRGGAAYVFERSGGQWVQSAKLTDPTPQVEEIFGWSVACHGSVGLVGAQMADRPILDSGVVFAVDFGDGGPGCPADWDGSGTVNSNDISAFLSAWLDSVQNGNLIADFDQSGSVNSNDISAFLSAWLAAVGGGC